MDEKIQRRTSFRITYANTASAYFDFMYVVCISLCVIYMLIAVSTEIKLGLRAERIDPTEINAGGGGRQHCFKRAAEIPSLR